MRQLLHPHYQHINGFLRCTNSKSSQITRRNIAKQIGSLLYVREIMIDIKSECLRQTVIFNTNLDPFRSSR